MHHWPVKRVSLFDKTLPESRWNCSKFVLAAPKSRRNWKVVDFPDADKVEGGSDELPVGSGAGPQ